MRMSEKIPSRAEIAAMLARMHNAAANSEAKAGRHWSSAHQDQLATKYRNIANDQVEEDENNGEQSQG